MLLGRDVFPSAHFSTSSVLWHFLQDLTPLKRATFNSYFVHVLDSLFGALFYLVHCRMAPAVRPYWLVTTTI